MPLKEWNSPDTAPTDGTPIQACFAEGNPVLVRWKGRWELGDGSYWSPEDMDCWLPLEASSTTPSPASAKRRTELHVIDHNGGEHMLVVWHEGKLEVISEDGANFGQTSIAERDEEWDKTGYRVLASFPTTYGVLLHDDPSLDYELTEISTSFAREVALEMERDKTFEEMYREARVEVERLRGELTAAGDRLREVKVWAASALAAEARRILDGPVALPATGKTLVTYAYMARDGSVSRHNSYEVDHEDEVMVSWRFVAYLTNELRKLAEGGAG